MNGSNLELVCPQAPQRIDYRDWWAAGFYVAGPPSHSHPAAAAAAAVPPPHTSLGARPSSRLRRRSSPNNSYVCGEPEEVAAVATADTADQTLPDDQPAAAADWDGDGAVRRGEEGGVGGRSARQAPRLPCGSVAVAGGLQVGMGGSPLPFAD